MMVKLTPKEMSVCEQAAAFRWQLARASGVANQKRDASRDDSDLDLLGIKAEMAVAKVLDISYSPFEFGIDSGFDMWMHGVSIDVKATFYQSGTLLLKSKDAFRAHCCVLVSSRSDDDREMSVLGFADKKLFLEKCQPVDLGHGASFSLSQENLRPIEQLWLAATKNRIKFN